jgi:flagellin-like hook-associated protein FlgL
VIYQGKRDAARALQDLGVEGREKLSAEAKEKSALELKFKELVFARKVVEEGLEILESLTSKYQRLQSLVGQSMNAELDDLDRRNLNKRFQDAKNEFNELAANSQVGNVALFSGAFEEDPYVVPLDAESKEALSLRIDSFKLEDIGLERLKIDSLVNARKASSELIDLESMLAEVAALFKTRREFVDDKLTAGKYKMQAEEGAVEAPVNAALKSFKERMLASLKDEQERKAKLTGEETGLLIKTHC